MDVRWLVVVMCLIMPMFDCFVTENGFQDCFRKDSITCLQMQIFKAARSFINSPTIKIASGISLLKTENNEAKSLKEKEAEEGVQNAKDALSRQNALESYLIETAERWWTENKVIWNPAQTAKALADAIPDTLTSQLTTFAARGRGKNKKQMKQLQMLMPFLIAFALKFATLAAIALMVITVIAKKAILASVLSLVLSGFQGLKVFTSPNSKPHIQATEVMGYQQDSTDWDPYSYGGGRFSHYSHEDLLTSRSEPAPHQKMLIGHKAS